VTTDVESSMRQMLAGVLNAHYLEPDEPSHRAVWIDLTLDHIGDSADVELARSGLWSGTLAEWLKVGPGIVRRVPLVSVELTDRKPHGGKRFAWWGHSFKLTDLMPEDRPWRLKDTLPPEFFAEKKYSSTWHYYDTEELALADASRRAIAWARRTEVTP